MESFVLVCCAIDLFGPGFDGTETLADARRHADERRRSWSAAAIGSGMRAMTTSTRTKPSGSAGTSDRDARRRAVSVSTLSAV